MPRHLVILQRILTVCLLSAVGAGVCAAGPAFAARGHEFKLAVGWGVLDGNPELETCVAGCRAGIAGSGKGQLDKPVGVAVNEASGDFYVVDEANLRVERFGAGGAYLGVFDGSGIFEVEGKEETGGGPPTGSMLDPRAIAVDNSCVQLRLSEKECEIDDSSNGDVYVVDYGHEAIDKFAPDGEYIAQIHIPPEGSPGAELWGVAIDAQGNLWVTEDHGFGHRGFDEFDNTAPTNSFLHFTGDEGIRFEEPHPALAVGREGDLFANTTFESPFESVVQKFTPGGKDLGVLVRQQSRGAAVESASGDVYVDNVVSVGRFTPEIPGVEIERFGAEGQLVEGAGVGVNSVVVPGDALREGPVYVADAGAADVVVFPLEQPKPPTVAVSVASVTAESAVLQGVLNPRGARSEYWFEYGVCSTPSVCSASEYETSVPAPGEASVGTPLDFEDHAVSVHPQDLKPGTTYHFRLVARNEKTAPGEPVESSEVVFRTQPAVPVEHLLDDRGWEMVSPPHKHGTLIRQILESDVIQAADDGEAFTYETDTPTEDEPPGFSNFVQVMARRTHAGWVSEDIALPHSRATGQSIGEGQEYRFFSEDLSVGLVQPLGAFESATSPDATEQTPYSRTDFVNGDVELPCVTSCYKPLVSAADVGEEVRFGEEGKCPPRLICGPVVIGASPDGRHVILRSSAGLTEGAGANGGLYEWNNGTLSFVSLLPTKQAASLASGPTLGGGGVRGAVSSDGSKVVWTGNSGKSLFLRDMATEESVELNIGLSGTPEYEAASANGSRIFFVDGGDLYVYEAEKGEAVALTTPIEVGEETRTQGEIAGVSEDGSYVYFVANGRLSEEVGAEEGTCHGDGSNEADRCYLYMEHNSGGVWTGTKLVALLSGADSRDFASSLQSLTARVSPDGRWLVFMSQLPLTGYDNRDAVSGARDEEVFLFDSVSSKLACVSCDPSGARPDGVEYRRLEGGLVAGDRVWPGETWLAGNVPGWTPYRLGQAFYQSRYLLDDGRVFFNSSDALVPGDVNGTEDVYEFEPMGVGSCSVASLTFVEAEGGCMGLVSSGSSRVESAFLDASVSGADVFFLTASQLSSADFDSGLDVYDARECSVGSPCLVAPALAAPPCVTESSCKAAPSLQPELFGASASALFSGLGNVSPVVSSTVAAPVVTRAARLAKGLATCRRQHPKAKKRVVCERQVRAKYAARSAVRKAGRR